MTIIGICGYKQSGKSVAADYLKSKYNFVGHNFKTALIKELKENFPDLLEEIRSDEQYWCEENYIENPTWTIDRLFEEKPPLIRALMKNYGTEVRRKEWYNYWIKQYLDYLPKNCNVVTDDVRFANDAVLMNRLDGIIIRIIKTGQVNNDTHQTESEIDLITPDYTIEAEMGDHQKIHDELDKIIDRLSN